MSWESIGVISGIVLAVLGVAYHLTTKMAQMELKLNIIWDFLMEKAMASMIVNGLGTINSPLVISEEAVSWFTPLKSELQTIYQKNKNMTDHELAFEIQRKLGKRINAEICIPHGIYSGECVLIAVAVAKS